jgi:hypothetical protein
MKYYAIFKKNKMLLGFDNGPIVYKNKRTALKDCVSALGDKVKRIEISIKETIEK